MGAVMELGEGVPVVEKCHDDTNGKIAADALCGDLVRRHMDIQNIPAGLKSFIKLVPFPYPKVHCLSGVDGLPVGESSVQCGRDAETRRKRVDQHPEGVHRLKGGAI